MGTQWTLREQSGRYRNAKREKPSSLRGVQCVPKRDIAEERNQQMKGDNERTFYKPARILLSPFLFRVSRSPG